MFYIDEKIINLGENNKKQKIFEGEIPLNKGMSYNSYLILDNYNCLLDTVDESILDKFITNFKKTLGNKRLDYFVIHHLEPDHTAGIKKIIELNPHVNVFISKSGYDYLKNFYRDIHGNFTIIKEGSILNLGTHTLTFVEAPMVHWPEVLVSYESHTKTLFSADAFGSFTCFEDLDSLNYPDQDELLYEERRYYTNIVGKYGSQVMALLNKASTLDIKRVLALHGPMHTKRIPLLIEKYTKWATYEHEHEGVLIVCATIYGNTKHVSKILEKMFIDRNYPVEYICLNDMDDFHALSETFIYKNIVLLCPTFNLNIFPLMEHYLINLRNHTIKNKRFAIIENGSWAPQAGKLIEKYIAAMPGNNILNTKLTIKSSYNEQTDKKILMNIVEEVISGNFKNEENEQKLPSWICKECGYVYHGESVPEDYICPICGKPHDIFILEK